MRSVLGSCGDHKASPDTMYENRSSMAQGLRAEPASRHPVLKPTLVFAFPAVSIDHYDLPIVGIRHLVPSNVSPTEDSSAGTSLATKNVGLKEGC